MSKPHDSIGSFSRREFLALPAGLAALAGGSQVMAANPAGKSGSAVKADGALQVSIGEHRVVTRDAVREPALFQLRSGELLLTYHVQGDRHFAERHGMRSRDGGKTWVSEPRRAHREQAMGQGADGTVLAMDIYTFERKPGEYLGTFFRSSDGGATFTGPHECVVRMDRVASQPYPTPDHFPPDDHPLRKFYQPLPEYYHPVVARSSDRRGPTFWRTVMESDGRWLATMQGHFHADKCHRTMLVESKDEGKTWTFVSTIAFRHSEPGDGFCEPVMQRVPDGSLLCVLRRGGKLPLAQCRSLDGGRTWSPPELLAGHGVDPDLCLMANGVLACTFGRPGLHIMFSLDGCGRKWSHLTPIGDWRSSTYMGIVEIAPDQLLLVYDRNDTPVGHEPDLTKAHVGSTTVRVVRSAG